MRIGKGLKGLEERNERRERGEGNERWERDEGVGRSENRNRGGGEREKKWRVKRRIERGREGMMDREGRSEAGNGEGIGGRDGEKGEGKK